MPEIIDHTNALDLSIIIPSYNEEESLPELIEWINRVCNAHALSAEVIIIDDGSTDKSWETIKKLHALNPNVLGVKFRRNYGKSAALHTGFQKSVGRVVITMDADLQDSPDEIPMLYNMIIEEGYDLVSGWKKKRHDPTLTKRIPSKLYNWVTSKMSGIQLHDMNCGLKAYKADVVKSIEVYGEMHRYIPVMAKKAGFYKIGEKVVEHRARKYGVTKFGLERFVFGMLDLMTILFTTKYGRRPMHLFGTMGILSFFIGFIITCVLIIKKLIAIHYNLTFRDVTDQPLFYIALTLVVLGVQLFLAGFLGELIAGSRSDRNFYHIAEEHHS